MKDLILQYELISDKLNAAKSVALFCHIRPDLDTVGSAVGLKLALESMGKSVFVFCDSKVPERYFALHGVSSISSRDIGDDETFDLYFAVDTSTLERLGKYCLLFTSKTNSILLDHHIAHEDYASLTVIDPEAASVSELVFELLTHMGVTPSADSARALYFGLVSDTGGFLHSSAQAETLERASRIRALCGDIEYLTHVLIKNSSKARLCLIARVLPKIRFLLGGKLCLLVVTNDDLLAVGADKSDTEGFCDLCVNCDGVEVGISIMESSRNVYKASLRSAGKVDVNKIAGEFGGGGHVKASGCVVSGYIDDVIRKLETSVEFFL